MSGRFCPGCGKELHDDEHVCPECGLADSTFVTKKVVRRGDVMRLNGAFVLLIAYGIISVIEGVPTAFASNEVVNVSNGLLGDSLMPNTTEYVKMLSVEGFISMFSGIFAIIAAICCFKRVRPNIAMAACLAASAMVLTELIFYPETGFFMLMVEFLIGMLVLRMIFNSRNVFVR